MNIRLVPKHFVSDGAWAFFVDGYTSDDLRDWRLRVALIGDDGRPDVQTIREYQTAIMSGDLRLVTADQTYDDELGITYLIGNTQRMCQGIPAIRGAY